MKKLLTLMIILGLASMANAGLIFTVNGLPQEPEVWLEPSEIIELGLELSAGETITSYVFGYHLSNDQAELITDGASGSHPDILDPMTDIEFPQGFDFPGELNANEAQYVKFSAGQLFSPAVAGPTILMAELYVHCLDATDVILTIDVEGTTIIDGVNVDEGTVHTLIIHQTPEPMTIALLGLGGLFLRRRK